MVYFSGVTPYTVTTSFRCTLHWWKIPADSNTYRWSSIGLNIHPIFNGFKMNVFTLKVMVLCCEKSQTVKISVIKSRFPLFLSVKFPVFFIFPVLFTANSQVQVFLFQLMWHPHVNFCMYHSACNLIRRVTSFVYL